MAIFLSDLMTNGGAQARGEFGGQENTYTATVRLPAGYTPTDGDIWKFSRLPVGTIIDRVVIRSDALGASIDMQVGYERPTVNPGKAYNATSNPYITNAIGTADPNFIEDTVEAPFASGGFLDLSRSGFTEAQTVAGFTGLVDISMEVINTAATALSADAEVKITFYNLYNDEQPQGEFSGNNSLNYTTNYPI
jgi:hypothetical protein